MLEIDADLLFRLAGCGREHRRVLRPMPSARKAHLPGPRVPLAFRPLTQEDLKAVRAVAQDDHHGGGGFRLQFGFGEFHREQELPEPIEGGFGHPETVYALSEYNGIHPRNIRLGLRASSDCARCVHAGLGTRLRRRSRTQRPKATMAIPGAMSPDATVMNSARFPRPGTRLGHPASNSRLPGRARGRGNTYQNSGDRSRRNRTSRSPKTARSPSR